MLRSLGHQHRILNPKSPAFRHHIVEIGSNTMIKQRLLGSCVALMIAGSSGGWLSRPAQAQNAPSVLDNPTAILVEAFRLAAPNTGLVNDGLYGLWQVKGENVVSWSRFCDRPTTPEEFEVNEPLARQIMTCVIGDLLREEYAASNNDLGIAILRSASWWMTGDSTRYQNDPTTNAYAQGVVNAYIAVLRQQR